MLLGTYSPAAHRGIARYAAEHGWHLHADMARVPQVPRGWRGDGIVAGLGPWDEPAEFLREAIAAGIPAVDIYHMRPEIAVARVSADHEAVGRAAAEHLLAAGWRRFAWFSRENHPPAERRLAGFTAALGRRCEPVRRLAPELAEGRPGVGWAETLEALRRDLRACRPPFAIFAFNDYDAALAEAACLASGLRVPEDAGIVGVDDNELVVTCQPVPLSSVRLRLDEVGYSGAALLDRLMSGDSAPKEPILIAPGGVAARASTDTVPATHPAVRRALAHMTENFTRPLTTDRIAAAAKVPRRTLELAFRQELGRSPHQQLTLLRLREAERLLGSGGGTVREVAKACGFSSGPHLHLVFRRAHGSSPRRWRREARP